ncbi:MAG: alpha/beta fold hydrolase [Candidatus Pacebacteria bacterium]|nr:alpha/beta fold hydrolase [Candidatus Paceibacterota bacterium]
MIKTNIDISTTNNEKVKGFVLRDISFTGKRPVILVLHGWTSSTRRFPERVEPLLKMGYVCVMFDMRGHGNTGYELANYSRKDHLDDCLAAFDYISKSGNVDNDNISVLGSSYGGYMAVLLTEKRPIKNLILLAPAQYQNEMFTKPQLTQDEKERRQYRLQHHTPEDNHALAVIHNFKGKILLIQPELDEQVPAQVASDYLQAMNTNYTHKIIKGADHSFYNKDTNKQMISEVEKWFKKQNEN